MHLHLDPSIYKYGIFVAMNSLRNSPILGKGRKHDRDVVPWHSLCATAALPYSAVVKEGMA